MKEIAPKKRRSVIWKITDEEFTELVNSSKNMSQVLAHFKLQNKGGNYKTCKERISVLGIKTNHFVRADNLPLLPQRQITKEEFEKRLCTHSVCKNVHLKKFLIKFGLLKYECGKCKNSGEWESQPLSLQLEHKNGVSDDNTLSNLEFLCPNCHSQTETFAGKKLKKKYLCKKCETTIAKTNKSSMCNKCLGVDKRVVKRVSKEELEALIIIYPITQIGKMLGVSDNGIRKWCKSYDIEHKKLSRFSHGKQKSV